MQETICPECVYSREYHNFEYLQWLLGFVDLVNSPCPVGRHELTNREWILIGMLSEQKKKIAEGKRKDMDNERS